MDGLPLRQSRTLPPALGAPVPSIWRSPDWGLDQTCRRRRGAEHAMPPSYRTSSVSQHSSKLSRWAWLWLATERTPLPPKSREASPGAAEYMGMSGFPPELPYWTHLRPGAISLKSTFLRRKVGVQMPPVPPKLTPQWWLPAMAANMSPLKTVFSSRKVPKPPGARMWPTPTVGMVPMISPRRSARPRVHSKTLSLTCAVTAGSAKFFVCFQ